MRAQQSLHKLCISVLCAQHLRLGEPFQQVHHIWQFLTENLKLSQYWGPFRNFFSARTLSSILCKWQKTVFTLTVWGWLQVSFVDGLLFETCLYYTNLKDTQHFPVTIACFSDLCPIAKFRYYAEELNFGPSTAEVLQRSKNCLYYSNERSKVYYFSISLFSGNK